MASATQNTGIFERKTCCIVSGASRGLGKSMAIKFSSAFPSGSLFILLSRDKKQLDCVQSEINAASPHIMVVTKMFDQCNLDRVLYESQIKDALEEAGVRADEFDQAIMVHNAGTPGDPSKYIRELSDVDLVKGCFDMNISGMVLLNTVFLQIFSTGSVSNRVVIGITSLSAVKPMRSWSLYCTAKAARDMFFQVLALEEPAIRVLNYAPGPCQTDMFTEVTRNTKDPEIFKEFHSLISENKVLKPDTSVAKLMEILRKDTFHSGAHIDFYDEI